MVSESIKRYKEQRDKLRQYFENEKTGDQTLFLDQAKLFKPLIESQQESSKDILEKLATNQDVLTNVLQAAPQALQYPLDQLGIEDVLHSTPKKDEKIMNINLDMDLLNDTHRENLQEMKLDLPSEVQEKGNIQETLDKIGKENRKIGQYLGISSK